MKPTLFFLAALSLPLNAAAKTTSSFLDEVKKNETLLNAEARAKKLSSHEAAALRKDLYALERRSRAAARKGRELADDTGKSMQAELDKIAATLKAIEDGR